MANSGIYAPHHYDRFFRLRAPLALWAVAGWALLHFVLLIPQAAEALGVSADLMADWRLAPAYSLVLLVMVAYDYRLPQTGRFMRGLWYRGRSLLLAGLGIGTAGFIILRWPLLTRPDYYQFSDAAIILGINIACLTYVASSRSLGDLFADYPEATDAERTRVAPRRASKPPVSAGEAHYQRALALMNEKRLDDALILFHEALSLDPKHAKAWNDCGKLLLQMGYPEEALQAFGAAQEAISQ